MLMRLAHLLYMGQCTERSRSSYSGSPYYSEALLCWPQCHAHPQRPSPAPEHLKRACGTAPEVLTVCDADVILHPHYFEHISSDFVKLKEAWPNLCFAVPCGFNSNNVRRTKATCARCGRQERTSSSEVP